MERFWGAVQPSTASTLQAGGSGTQLRVLEVCRQGLSEFSLMTQGPLASDCAWAVAGEPRIKPGYRSLADSLETLLPLSGLGAKARSAFCIRSSPGNGQRTQQGGCARLVAQALRRLGLGYPAVELCALGCTGTQTTRVRVPGRGAVRASSHRQSDDAHPCFAQPRSCGHSETVYGLLTGWRRRRASAFGSCWGTGRGTRSWSRRWTRRRPRRATYCACPSTRRTRTCP